ncbi:putative periplasmic serine endoprotease DegP-like precursor [bacterium BMS3Bbin11]|nr:putative periplasmic serine endoprotease DegP-like precursor [bacterium BMS3Abin11]GBE45482.1 putative periplasmic serine endoprotease DegP-like precursor [bacterium BMS3Bbin11]HDH15974.1 DegQ family serine endoprotease [Gammaproteobacteria bacterium]
MKKSLILPVLFLFTSFMTVIANANSLPDFVGLVEKQGKAVVNISTMQKPKSLQPGLGNLQIPDLPEDSPYHDFFEKFFGQLQRSPQGTNPQPMVRSLGSGFIISADGYVLTSAHVVNNADEIVVRMTDRREMLAKVIGSDIRSDVALLKIEAKNLPYLKPGKPDELKVGEWVLAIGSPFGFENTATAGIVSAKGRSLPNENYIPFIQTDVAINPGNSGGPLFNMKGEVVGINAQIYSRSGGYMGLAFSVPIDLAMQVADQLRAGGKVKRGWLGVTIQDVNRELAEALDMDKPFGALVSSVLPESPASKSDLQVEDVIVEYNGKPVRFSSDLPFFVGRSKVGTTADLTVLRSGKLLNVKVKIGHLPESGTAALDKKNHSSKKDTTGLLGMYVRDLSKEEKKQLDLDYGVLVVQLKANSTAVNAGIRKGDVLLMLNKKKIDNVKTYNAIAGSLKKGRPVAILVRRGNGSQFLVLKP